MDGCFCLPDSCSYTAERTVQTPLRGDRAARAAPACPQNSLSPGGVFPCSLVFRPMFVARVWARTLRATNDLGDPKGFLPDVLRSLPCFARPPRVAANPCGLPASIPCPGALRRALFKWPRLTRVLRLETAPYSPRALCFDRSARTRLVGVVISVELNAVCDSGARRASCLWRCTPVACDHPKWYRLPARI